MGFIKYSVVELGVEETIPGWVKQAEDAKSQSDEQHDTDKNTANINAEDKKEKSQEQQ